MLKPHTILGISPGTRIIGIAIWRQDRLTEWQIKTFKGSWTEGKLRDILYTLQRMIDSYEITSLAIKKPDLIHSSLALDKLVSELQLVAQRKKVKVKMYSLEELKKFCSSDRKFTKAQMIQFIAEKNPVLHFEYNKEQKNRNPYYVKMFEAIVAVMLCQKEYHDKLSVPSPYSFFLL